MLTHVCIQVNLNLHMPVHLDVCLSSEERVGSLAVVDLQTFRAHVTEIPLTPTHTYITYSMLTQQTCTQLLSSSCSEIEHVRYLNL